MSVIRNTHCVFPAMLLLACVFLHSCGLFSWKKDRIDPLSNADTIAEADSLVDKYLGPTDLALTLEADTLACLNAVYALLQFNPQWTLSDRKSTALRRELAQLLRTPESYALPESAVGLQRLCVGMFDRLIGNNEVHDSLTAELGYTLAYLQLMLSAKTGTTPDRRDLLDCCRDSLLAAQAAEALHAGQLYDGLLAAMKPGVRERMGWIMEFLEYEGIRYTGYTVPAFKEDSTGCMQAVRPALRGFGLLTTPDSLVDETAIRLAVMEFQRRNGLEPDGVVGKRTVEAFAKSNAERYGQLLANLERARKETDPVVSDLFVEVNVPEMALRVYMDGEEVSRHKVIVGQRKDQQTPSFNGSINEMVVNPEWTVPFSISTKELLPKQRNDSSYLRNHHYRVFDKFREEVDPSEVNWWRLDEYYFPYTIVQKAGPWNALGTVKFLFPNEHLVYIHDTPSRNLFNKSERDFSHGCIRVEEPYKLAELILEHGSKRVDDKMFFELLDTASVYSIPIFPRIPVHVRYHSVVRDSAHLVFYPDLYGRDAEWMDRARENFASDDLP